jgi:PAS domain-containing protein
MHKRQNCGSNLCSSDTNSPMKKIMWNYLNAIFLAALGMTAILLIDAMAPDITLAPLVGICFLFIAAWLFGPFQVAGILAVLSLVVAQQLWQPATFHDGSNLVTPLAHVRLYSFVCGGVIAVLFSAYRQRFENARNEMSTLFGLLPVPILIADFSGTVIFASESAIAMTGLSREKVVGARLEDFIGTQLLEETEENWFQQWLQTPSNSPFQAKLRIGGAPVNARVLKMGEAKISSIALILDDLFF